MCKCKNFVSWTSLQNIKALEEASFFYHMDIDYWAFSFESTADSSEFFYIFCYAGEILFVFPILCVGTRDDCGVYSKYTAYFPPDAVERITDMWLNKDPSIMILIIGCLWGRLPDLQYTLVEK